MGQAERNAPIIDYLVDNFPEQVIDRLIETDVLKECMTDTSCHGGSHLTIDLGSDTPSEANVQGEGK